MVMLNCADVAPSANTAEGSCESLLSVGELFRTARPSHAAHINNIEKLLRAAI